MLRDILNRARHRDAALDELEIHVLHRGAPGDRRVVPGKRVLGIRAGGIEVAPEADEGVSFIPYHRFLAIHGAGGAEMWAKGAGERAPVPEIATEIHVVLQDAPTLVVDGSAGEGGGQILRTSLALSIATGRPFVIEKIRASRKKPGLERQHLTCVEAAARVSGAEVAGAVLGSSRVEFRPRPPKALDTTLDIGSAGSVSLVLQTVVYALAGALAPSRLVVKGGTHALWAPPYPFLAEAWLPLARRAGLDASLDLRAPGFYPAGGGEVELGVSPSTFVPLHVEAPSDPASLEIHAIVAGLPEDIAHREIGAASEALAGERIRPSVRTVPALGKGNAIWLVARDTASGVANVFSAIGEIGVRAEELGRRVALAYWAWRDSGAAVCEHLADQLMLPIALAGEGSFTTNALSLHARTNIEVIRAFTGRRLHAWQVDERRVRVALGAAAS